MIVKNIIDGILPSIWSLVVFISMIAITLRSLYIFKGSRKFVLHKEILSLLFIIYILCLYKIVMNNMSSSLSLIPFKEIFRYDIGSYKFMNYIISNIFIFIPLGFFTSYFLNTKKASTLLLSNIIIGIGIQGLNYEIKGGFITDNIILNLMGGMIGYLIYIGLSAIKSKLPKFMKSDTFLNILLIVIIVLVVLYSVNINIFSYL